MKTKKMMISCLILISGSTIAFAGGKTEMNTENQTKERKAKDEFVIDEHTAIVMTDPQNDFLSEKGKGWGLFGENKAGESYVCHMCL